MVYIGLRDVESQERKVLESLNIAAYYMSDVDRLGIQRVVEDSLARLDTGATSKIHLRQPSKVIKSFISLLFCCNCRKNMF